MTRVLSYALALALGALAACGVFVSAEAVCAAGLNPFDRQEVTYGQAG